MIFASSIGMNLTTFSNYHVFPLFVLDLRNTSPYL